MRQNQQRKVLPRAEQHWCLPRPAVAVRPTIDAGLDELGEFPDRHPAVALALGVVAVGPAAQAFLQVVTEDGTPDCFRSQGNLPRRTRDEHEAVRIIHSLQIGLDARGRVVGERPEPGIGQRPHDVEDQQFVPGRAGLQIFQEAAQWQPALKVVRTHVGRQHDGIALMTARGIGAQVDDERFIATQLAEAGQFLNQQVPFLTGERPLGQSRKEAAGAQRLAVRMSEKVHRNVPGAILGDPQRHEPGFRNGNQRVDQAGDQADQQLDQCQRKDDFAPARPGAAGGCLLRWFRGQPAARHRCRF